MRSFVFATVTTSCLLAFACGDVASTHVGPGREGGVDLDADPHHEGSVVVGDASPGCEPGVVSEAPMNHRPNDSQCATPPAAGDCLANGQPTGSRLSCSSDNDCTTGDNGRCNVASPFGGAAGCDCDYDTCMVDTDCKTGELCVCHGSPYTGGDGNTCMPGNCRVHSDCGPNGYCSPSENLDSCGFVGGYYCHTCRDTCVNDSDCPMSDDGFPTCVWSSTAGHWQCGVQLACA
jgi:hypothetical protein